MTVPTREQPGPGCDSQPSRMRCTSTKFSPLIMVLGPTGVGKTARSVELARLHAAPVVVLDRIQAHPELDVGSGRPTRAELHATTRIYLDQRRVADGFLRPADAVDHLESILKQLGETGPVVLEGGSISVLRELIYRTGWRTGRTVHVEYVLEAGPDRYERRVARRVEEMLGYGIPFPHGVRGRTLLEETAQVWRDALARPHLETVIGYGEVLEVCNRHGLDPSRLGEYGHLWRYLFTAPVRDAHLDYSRQQRLQIAAALPALQDLGCTTEVLER